MKRSILIAAFLLISITLIAFKNQIKKAFVPNSTGNTEIGLSIQTDNKYASTAYDDATAQVHVTVTRINGAKRTIAYEKDFQNTQLKNYLNMNNVPQTLTVTNISNRKEQLEISYTVTYNSNGSILKLGSETVINATARKGNLVISI